MLTDEMLRVCALWTKLERQLEILQAWDSPRGILFESRDDSHREVLTEVADLLGASRVIDVSREIRKKTEWREKFVRFVDGSLPVGALVQTGNERICLVMPDLVRRPAWMQLNLKFLFENAKYSFCCLAGTAAPCRVEGFLASHFFRTRKLGRPSRPH